MPFAFGTARFLATSSNIAAASRVDPASLEKDVVSALGGLWREAGRDDVEGLLKQSIEAELPRGEDRMASRPVGEDQLPPRQPADFAREQRVRLEAGAVDIVHELQKALGQVDVLLHQPA